MLMYFVGAAILTFIGLIMMFFAEEFETFPIPSSLYMWTDKDSIQFGSAALMLVSIVNSVVLLAVGSWEIPFLCIQVGAVILYGRILYNGFLGMDSGNILYRCSKKEKEEELGCGKLVRRYQLSMYEAGHQKVRCPHCESEDLKEIKDFEYVKETQKWMNVVMDAPKADRKSMKMVIKSINQMKKYNEEVRLGTMFEEYQSLKPSMEWVKNIDSFNKKKKVTKTNDTDTPEKFISDVKESLLEGEIRVGKGDRTVKT